MTFRVLMCLSERTTHSLTISRNGRLALDAMCNRLFDFPAAMLTTVTDQQMRPGAETAETVARSKFTQFIIADSLLLLNVEIHTLKSIVASAADTFSFFDSVLRHVCSPICRSMTSRLKTRREEWL